LERVRASGISRIDKKLYFDKIYAKMTPHTVTKKEAAMFYE